jgi:protein gp37
MTGIEWTDRTWNPTTGCTEVSPGCDNCYAKTIAERFRGHAAFPNGFDVQVKADRVNDPLRWRKPARIFVNSMSDLFHADIDRTWIAEIYAVMAAARRHTFQVLTKRAARMRTLLADDAFAEVVRARAIGKGLPAGEWTWPLPNVWLGVSVENQQWADIRIPQLLMTPAAVRFLSCEPLLGPVSLTHVAWAKGGGTHLDVVNGRHGVPGVWSSTAKAVDWVIVGGESGRKARPMHPRWAQTLRDQCAEAGVPYFFKQWGEYVAVPLEDDADFAGGRAFQHPTGGRCSATIRVPGPSGTYRNSTTRLMQPGERGLGGTVMLDTETVAVRVGKKAAGRLLDGREHNAFPQTAVTS